MTEIELRFQIPASQSAAVRRWVAGSAQSPATEERLQAIYFDTPARDLARAGFALRLRREGEVWVQTLKGAAPDGMTRLEHNVALGDATPALDVARHADHPAGQALQALVDTLPAGALQALFRTDITRLSRTLRTRHGVVELALDQGALLAGEGDALRRTPVAELEIELKSGQPRAVLEVARVWAIERFGLSLELRTKALRGDLLARQAEV
ncbi:CYTH domain-containing protein, partial [Mitsuaria sp. TWR114]|uniref:CYTH domain-containing protein n=1 Tax=Mitsuaria sp. TWR114 TaxID=2601731 RepID=UPI00164AF09E